MLFAPFAGEAVCRRVVSPAVPHGTPNMEPRQALDHAAWLWHPDLAEGEPGGVLFRLNFKSTRAETVRLQASGDLCYALALDGALIGRGPDTADVSHWSYSTYELTLRPGTHRLEALVWWARAPQAPEGRMSWRGGFACVGLDRATERFTTGIAPWRVGRLQGLDWGEKLNRSYHVIGCSGHMDLSKLDARNVKWVKPAVVRGAIPVNVAGIVEAGWTLHPSVLPEQRHDLWRGGRVRSQLPRFARTQNFKFGQLWSRLVIFGHLAFGLA